MRNASLHAHAFHREIAANGSIWTMRDAKAFPAPLSQDGARAMPLFDH